MKGGQKTMANKINVKLILELHEAKLSRNTIAKSRHMSCHSVSDVINIAKEKGITYSDIRELDEQKSIACSFQTNLR